MRVLLIHNHYRQRGGEDQVFATEGELLEAAGHAVARYTLHNDLTEQLHGLELVRSALWNAEAFSGVQALIREFRPAVVHVHNTFPLLSPAVHHAARSAGVAVVQTLHNYRLYCPGATLFRDGRVCEICAPKSIPWPAVLHGCYRGSRLATAAASSTLVLHRVLRTWTRSVDVYIALSESSKRKFVEYGLPADKLRVKPNALFPDPGVASCKQDYGLFVGRLAPEKGLGTLLAALRRLQGRVPFRIVGTGPLEAEARRAAQEIPGVSWLGERTPGEVMELLGGARFLVVPSEWLEPFGRVVIEALARGTPVLASRIGALEDLVAHGRTGYHFAPGDAGDLARQMDRMADGSTEVADLAVQARAEYESRFSAGANLAALEGIYATAIHAGASRGAQ